MQPTFNAVTLDDWIARAAIPFSVASRERCNAAIDKVSAALGNAVELLGFGEALHGGADLLLLRNRLFQRLVEAHGYSAIAIESSFPRSHLVNGYINGHGPASYDAVQAHGFSHGFGALAANRELVEWMRQYNADPAHQVKLHFYGFDSPTEMMGSDSPRQVLQFALAYLAAVDSTSGQARRERIDALLGPDALWENPAAMMDPTQSIGLSSAATALRMETEDLISELRVGQPELVAKSDASRYREALHYAVVARQLLTYHAAVARPAPNRTADLLGQRDAMMADNLAYIVAQERGRGKVLAFAHNSHLQRGKAQWQLGPDLLVWWPAGAHLNELFGAHYAVIGTGVGISDANGIGQPEAGSLEARLMAAPGPARFLPTYQGHGLPAADVVALPLRSGSMKNSSYFALTPQSLTDFDWLAFLDSITAASAAASSTEKEPRDEHFHIGILDREA
ncbi:MAG: erythromycin esterase family protein [Caldilineaceae bacterium]